ncbi:hypothetical protein HID58_094798 [Brassica napus]|uniref:Uncharacterized protein n=1 Tax=Brassica napus TaxID=3708 RepID=A0ABQ7X621_BRANA|nr:hypothetical protein HID58_094798 [Brassica napus]
MRDKYRDVNYHESSSDGSSEETEYFRPTNGLLREFLSEYEKDKKSTQKEQHAQLVQEWDMMTEEQRCPYHDKAKKLMNILDEWAAFTLEKLNRSKGSNFLADCLVELRDQNASKDFILLLEELLPYAQSVESYKRSSEFIFLKLVSELQMEARFSLDSILSLIAALSGDLKYDFAPFLPRLVKSLLILLNNGGLKNAETIEQIFTSWSKIIENLRFCFARDVRGALRSTLELRYYPSDIINEKMSKSMSCVLDLARPRIKMILSEVAGNRKELLELVSSIMI